jgi:LmbE family N-acetylglucosaminyl deacetylase
MDSTHFNETPFATDSPGASDAQWRATLSGVPEWMPNSRTLAVVSPHPDDETLGAGGLIYSCTNLGYAITVILVTDGEAACPEQPRLAERRVEELRRSLMRIAPDGAHVDRLRFPDGRVAAFEHELAQRLLSVVPLDCTLVAPYENDGHSDHAAVSRACQAAARKLGVPCVRYPIWAWHRLEPGALDTSRMGRFDLDDAAREAKRQALRCYRSQLEPRPGGAIVPPHVLEYFERPYEVFLL